MSFRTAASRSDYELARTSCVSLDLLSSRANEQKKETIETTRNRERERERERGNYEKERKRQEENEFSAVTRNVRGNYDRPYGAYAVAYAQGTCTCLQRFFVGWPAYAQNSMLTGASFDILRTYWRCIVRSCSQSGAETFHRRDFIPGTTTLSFTSRGKSRACSLTCI